MIRAKEDWRKNKSQAFVAGSDPASGDSTHHLQPASNLSNPNLLNTSNTGPSGADHNPNKHTFYPNDKTFYFN